MVLHSVSPWNILIRTLQHGDGRHGQHQKLNGQGQHQGKGENIGSRGLHLLDHGVLHTKKRPLEKLSGNANHSPLRGTAYDYRLIVSNVEEGWRGGSPYL